VKSISLLTEAAAQNYIQSGIPLCDAEAEFRRAIVNAALRAEDGNRTRAAKRLVIGRNTLIREIKGRNKNCFNGEKK